MKLQLLFIGILLILAVSGCSNPPVQTTAGAEGLFDISSLVVKGNDQRCQVSVNLGMNLKEIKEMGNDLENVQPGFPTVDFSNYGSGILNCTNSGEPFYLNKDGTVYNTTSKLVTGFEPGIGNLPESVNMLIRPIMCYYISEDGKATLNFSCSLNQGQSYSNIPVFFDYNIGNDKQSITKSFSGVVQKTDLSIVPSSPCNESQYLESYALGFPGFEISPDDFLFTTAGQLTLRLKNVMVGGRNDGKSVSITNIKATYAGKTVSNSTPSGIIGPENYYTYVITGLPAVDICSPFSINVSIETNLVDSGLMFTSTGKLTRSIKG